MTRTAFLFPGQGSQILGMGYDLFCEYDFVQEIFDAASEAAKINISRLCFKGPIDSLTKTINLQPAITAVNLSCLSAVEREGCRSDVSLGHSLGEYSALRSARTLSLSSTMESVFIRGLLMSREAKRRRGGMCALVGREIDVVDSLVKRCNPDGIVSVANHNSKYQSVISGDIESLDEVVLASKSMDIRAIPLKVEGAWHSALMKDMEKEFAFFLDKTKFKQPLCKVIHNVNSSTATGIEDIKMLLVKQICNPVLWYDSICNLIEEKIDIFVELGPGKVLTGLLKRILPKKYSCKIFNVNDMRTLDKFLHDIT